jgi:hypothetical protein
MIYIVHKEIYIAEVTESGHKGRPRVKDHDQTMTCSATTGG